MKKLKSLLFKIRIDILYALYVPLKRGASLLRKRMDKIVEDKRISERYW